MGSTAVALRWVWWTWWCGCLARERVHKQQVGSSRRRGLHTAHWDPCKCTGAWGPLVSLGFVARCCGATWRGSKRRLPSFISPPFLGQFVVKHFPPHWGSNFGLLLGEQLCRAVWGSATSPAHWSSGKLVSAILGLNEFDLFDMQLKDFDLHKFDLKSFDLEIWSSTFSISTLAL